MKQHKLVDNVFGWLAFLIAAFVYCSTIEPTASFWDCPEFITTGYKLEIGHPPGAPFFMLTANLFSQFVSNPSYVARMVNTMSALLSATTIMFLFWSITHLTRKLIMKDWNEITTAKTIIIEGSGLVGALIYAFSDTFWFSAVEGEVYAYSSAFTAIVFWLILKWEDHADEPHSDRWLILITYMTGLSIGVHLLNLLCIPAIVLVYCYRKFPKMELKGSLIALVISFVIIAAVLYGIVPGIITVGGWFELFFVNILGCPFNTGEIVYIILLVATVVWAIYESYSETNEKRSNISFLATFAMLGIPFYGSGWTAVAGRADGAADAGRVRDRQPAARAALGGIGATVGGVAVAGERRGAGGAGGRGVVGGGLPDIFGVCGSTMMGVAALDPSCLLAAHARCGGRAVVPEAGR